MKRIINIRLDGINTQVEITDNKLVIPKDIKNVHCAYNNLKELILPKGIRSVFCLNNNIEKLEIPKIANHK